MKILKTVTGNGPDIVVLHGGLANSDDMFTIVEELSKNYRVTNIDLPGGGKSEWSDSIKTIHDVANSILPELPEKATYIGWSKGGLTAQAITIKHPHKVNRLIGIATTPKFIAKDNWFGAIYPSYEDLLNSLFEQGTDTTDKFVRGGFEAEFANLKSKPAIYDRVMKICDQRPEIPKQVMLRLVNIVDNTDLRDGFQQITCPIDIIAGDQDPNLPKTTFAQIKALNPRVKIHEIPGAQHSLFFTHQQEFNQILNKILASKE